MGGEAGLMSTSSAVKTCTSSYSRYQTLRSRTNKEQSQQLLPVEILKPIGAIRRDPLERISKVRKNLLVEHREFLTWTSVFDRLGNKIRHWRRTAWMLDAQDEAIQPSFSFEFPVSYWKHEVEQQMLLQWRDEQQEKLKPTRHNSGTLQTSNDQVSR